MNNSRLHARNYLLFMRGVVSRLPWTCASDPLNNSGGCSTSPKKHNKSSPLNPDNRLDPMSPPPCRGKGRYGSKEQFGLNANWHKWRLTVCILTCTVLASGGALGARISDVRGTKHNLSAATDGAAYPGGAVPTRTVKATSETQVCVFCHTPHGATLGVTPLWNRKLSSATYAPYTSSSLDANVLQGTLNQPGGSSKLCLSCHDGTLAIGSVNVLNGLGSADTPGTQAISMTGVSGASGVMAEGSGTTTGYTRNLGIDLSNDHPISVTYTTSLSDRDGELRSVDVNQKYPAGTGTIIGLRSPGLLPKAPLEPTGTAGLGQIQCAACHDPHLRETNEATVGNQKFLRLNRFQEAAPIPAYNDVNDINCVACHDKDNGIAGTWIYSAHANADLAQGANQTYTASASAQREFPANLPVWKASCLNCHDTHTVQGSRWLLREGTDSIATPKAGGNSAIEETCYQCHSNDANTAITPLTNVPDIKSDFALARHMPITLTDQQGNVAFPGSPSAEAHAIGGNFAFGGTPYEWVDCSTTTNKCGADFVEQRSKLGAGTNNLVNRHAECSDCHNPHRVVKFRTFAPFSLSATPHSAGTHGDATDAQTHDQSGYTHSNIASGSLRGTFGVEPVYTGSASFANLPSSYDIKRGDPGVSTSTLVNATYVTREYQICLKCHSDYGYTDDNLADASTLTRPALGGTGLTLSNTNNLTHYTNQAQESRAPTAHQGEPATTDSGAAAAYATGIAIGPGAQINYRSWHPVMDATGRTAAIRGVTATSVFTLPWSNAVGTQTMYCSDCHGSDVTSTTSVIPNTGKSWGPHGSTKDFILKGAWDSATGDGQTNGLCFKCHDYSTYAAGGGTQTGFFLGGEPVGPTRIDGHTLHFNKIGKMRCDWCHVAVPHGWKNKGLLVNLNDVGPEAGLAAGTQLRNGVTTPQNIAPYYLNAVLKVKTFAASGQWKAADCGSAGAPGNGQLGLAWMSASGVPPVNNENCATPP